MKSSTEINLNNNREGKNCDELNPDTKKAEPRNVKQYRLQKSSSYE